MKLRPYQREAIDAVREHWRNGGSAPVIDIATGGGKSLVSGNLTKEIIEEKPTARIMLLVHVKELVKQNVEAVLRAWPRCPVGINSAGLYRRDKRSQVLYASIQSVARETPETLGVFDYILIDEAHMVPKDGNGQYLTLFRRFRQANEYLRICGLSATPYRLDSGRIDEGDDALFDKVVYQYDIGRGVEDGYLSPLISRPTGTVIDVSNIKRSSGEFVAKALEEAVNLDPLVKAAALEMVASGEDRRSWLAFCAGVDHAFAVRDALTRLGISCATVTGDTPGGERDRIFREFKAGRIRCLTGVNVFSVGFDAPNVDMLAFLRPTLSTGLYVQQAGRGTRLFDGKSNCIAAGSLVLTDIGLVPIENVTTSMRVWDGVEFVDHMGVVCNGIQKVISYAGLTVTPDHKLWTKEGWKEAWVCRATRTAIAVTGIEGRAVRETDCRFRGCFETAKQQAFIPLNKMLRMLSFGAERIYQSYKRYGWLSRMRETTISAEMVICQVSGGEISMREEDGPSFFGIRWAWDSIFISVNHRLRKIYDGTAEFFARSAGGSHQQQRPLRTRQSSLGDMPTEHEEQADGEVVVYDILNCGPRYRFTVNGLLVSNCRVLDFALNVRRHGPVDSINVSSDRSGKTKVDAVKTKECLNDACGASNYVQARQCSYCGEPFPFEERGLNHQETADKDAPIMSRELRDTWIAVDYIQAFPHFKKAEGAVPSMRVEYTTGLSVYNQYIAMEAQFMQGARAHRWWRIVVGTPVPSSTIEACQRIAAELTVLSIQIEKEKKYWNVKKLRVKRKDGRIIDIDEHLAARPAPPQQLSAAE